MLIAMLGEVQMARLLLYANVPVTARTNFEIAIRRYRKLGVIKYISARGISGPRVMLQISQDLPVYAELKALLLRLAVLLYLPMKLSQVNELYEKQMANARAGAVAQHISMQNPALFFKDDN